MRLNPARLSTVTELEYALLASDHIMKSYHIVPFNFMFVFDFAFICYFMTYVTT